MKKIQKFQGGHIIKRFNRFLFLLSEASGNLAGSIYSLVLSFIIQDLVKSQFINSLAGNLGLAISVIISFFAGHIIDHKSPWKIILLSDIILLPLFLGLIFILSVPFPYKVAIIILIDIVSIILGEFDSISRPKYLRMTLQSKELDSTVQYMNGIQTLFSILGYLLVFISISFLNFSSYFIVILVLYIVSALSILFLPKEKNKASNKVLNDTNIISGTKIVLQFLSNSKNTLILHITYILYMLRNQLVLSLIVYRIGQLNETFDRIHIIGLGIVSGVGLGIIFNTITRKITFSKRRLFSNLLYLSSTFFCLYIGHITTVGSFYFIGLSIGLIFGSGLPLFNLISSERLLLTPKKIIGRSTSIIRLLSILFVFLVSILLNFIDNLGIHSIYFDVSALITILTSLIFSKIEFRHTNSNN